MKIVADDKIPFLKGALEPFAQVDYLPGDRIDNAVLKNADIYLPDPLLPAIIPPLIIHLLDLLLQLP